MKQSEKKVQINQLLKSLCIKLCIEHPTTCDSRTHMDYINAFSVTACRYVCLSTFEKKNISQ